MPCSSSRYDAVQVPDACFRCHARSIQAARYPSGSEYVEGEDWTNPSTVARLHVRPSGFESAEVGGSGRSRGCCNTDQYRITPILNHHARPFNAAQMSYKFIFKIGCCPHCAESNGVCFPRRRALHAPRGRSWTSSVSGTGTQPRTAPCPPAAGTGRNHIVGMFCGPDGF